MHVCEGRSFYSFREKCLKFSGKCSITTTPSAFVFTLEAVKNPRFREEKACPQRFQFVLYVSCIPCSDRLCLVVYLHYMFLAFFPSLQKVVKHLRIWNRSDYKLQTQVMEQNGSLLILISCFTKAYGSL